MLMVREMVQATYSCVHGSLEERWSVVESSCYPDSDNFFSYCALLIFVFFGLLFLGLWSELQLESWIKKLAAEGVPKACVHGDRIET